MRTPKSVAAGIGAGTSIVAAGTLALASVSAIVAFDKWPIPDVPVPRAIALTAKAGADAAQRAASGPAATLLVAEVDAASFPRERVLGRTSTEGRARGADSSSVAGASSGAAASRRPVGARPSTATGAGAGSSGRGPVGGSSAGGGRSTGGTLADTTSTTGEGVKSTGPTLNRESELAPGVGVLVQDTVTQVGDTITQAGSDAGAAVDATGQTATGAAQQTTETVTGVVGHAADATASTVDTVAGETLGQAAKTAGSSLDPKR